jgi:hypothetical protein
MMKLTLIFLMLLVLNSFSQESGQYKNLSKNMEDYEFHSQMDLGAGIGLNYGGLLGFQVGYIPINHLVIFGSAGYYLVGFGWQVGASGYLMPKVPSKRFRVYGTVMYGTNVAIAIIDNSSYNKIYLGPTIGAGIEMRFGKSKKNGLNIDLFYPIRSSEYESDWNNLKNNPNFTDTVDPLPVTISVGYHFEIK